MWWIFPRNVRYFGCKQTQTSLALPGFSGLLVRQLEVHRDERCQYSFFRQLYLNINNLTCWQDAHVRKETEQK